MVSKKKESSQKEKKTSKKDKYTYAVGRRKTATAQVKLFEVKTSGTKKSAKESESKDKKEKANILVNGKEYQKYFPTLANQFIVEQPLRNLNAIEDYRFEVRVAGSGISAQAQAVRHGIAKALSLLDKKFKASLKTADLLKRDSRMVERKKAGLRKARRRRQWSKR